MELVSENQRVRETSRLRLVPVCMDFFDEIHTMDNDEEIMRFIAPGPKTHAQTQTRIEDIEGRWRKHGFSWWSLFLKETNDLIGGAVLQHLALDEKDPLEIGWRLKRSFRGQGFATEAAHEVLFYAFELVAVSVAHPDNHASTGVMKRLGMDDLGIQTAYGEDCAYFALSKDKWRSNFRKDTPRFIEH